MESLDIWLKNAALLQKPKEAFLQLENQQFCLFFSSFFHSLAESRGRLEDIIII